MDYFESQFLYNQLKDTQQASVWAHNLIMLHKTYIQHEQWDIMCKKQNKADN